MFMVINDLAKAEIMEAKLHQNIYVVFVASPAK